MDRFKVSPWKRVRIFGQTPIMPCGGWSEDVIWGWGGGVGGVGCGKLYLVRVDYYMEIRERADILHLGSPGVYETIPWIPEAEGSRGGDSVLGVYRHLRRTWGLTPHCGLGGLQSSYLHVAGPENPSWHQAHRRFLCFSVALAQSSAELCSPLWRRGGTGIWVGKRLTFNKGRREVMEGGRKIPVTKLHFFFLKKCSLTFII